jgi:prepilin-type N-terminal cleavage/methylation domain-containing protein
MKKILNNKGFTLAELIIVMGLVGILFTTAIGVYSAFFGSLRNVRAANHIYEETNNVMERIMKEIRLNTIDYDEYFNKFVADSCYPKNEIYGQSTCKYNEQFYSTGKDGVFGTDDDISLGKNREADVSLGALGPDGILLTCSPGQYTNSNITPPVHKRAIDLSTQDQLILINGDGTQKTIIKRIGDQIGILELIGKDTDFDGHMDDWECKTGYNCPAKTTEGADGTNAFIPISPKSLSITELKFIIAPADDPLKSYNDSSVQVQPFVTLKLKAEANPKIATEFHEEKRPEISLESMITTKLHQEVHRYCFRKPIANP